MMSDVTTNVPKDTVVPTQANKTIEVSSYFFFLFLMLQSVDKMCQTRELRCVFTNSLTLLSTYFHKRVM